MRRQNQKLYRTARSVLRDDAEVEKAVQEAWMIGYRSLAGFRGDAKLSTWLVRIVANESIARLRKLLEAKIDLLPETFRTATVRPARRGFAYCTNST